MFVSKNSLKSVSEYFRNKLKDEFSSQEIKSLFNICLENVLGLTKTDLILNPDRTVSESELLAVRSLIKGLLEGVPVQYILKETAFFGLNFLVNEHVLIPRPETEELVSIIVKENEGIQSVLDIGTGSGCIPISIKSKLPDTAIFGLDISKDAILVAEGNSKSLNLEVDFVQDDILKSKFNPGFEFDLIISNPPYVLESEKREMNENVLNYEPHLALFVEDRDPLLFYEAILLFSQKNLKKGGKVYFEIHEEMGNRIKKLFLDFGFSEIEIIKDFYGKNRFAKGNKI